MTWLHTWSGLVFCWILYLVFVTGTLGYFDTEIDHWMQPEYQLSEPVSSVEAVAAAQRYLQDAAADGQNWNIRPAHGRDPLYLSVVWRTQNADDSEAATQFHSKKLDGVTGEPQPEARDTTGGQTLYKMHYRLHYLPVQLGFYFVAIATMLMFIGLITGVVAHKKIFVDFFTFRWAKGQRSWLDLHNIFAVATLPFQFMITYSGLLFTVALWMPFIALGTYGFDFEELSKVPEEVFGQTTIEPANVAVPLVDLQPLVKEAMDVWGDDRIRSVQVSHPGDANARVIIDRAQGMSFLGESMSFNGTTGDRIGVFNPSEFTAAVFPAVLIGLHVGHFADTLIRWLYFLAGVLGAAMVATGAIYWAIKRKPRSGSQVGFGYWLVDRLNVATIVGLLAGIAAFFWANRVLPVSLEQRGEWELHAMFMVWGTCFLHACVRPLKKAWIEQCVAVSALLLALPVLNLVTTDVHLFASLSQGDWYRAGFDLTVFMCGLVALLAAALISRHWQTQSLPLALPEINQIEQPASAG